MSDKQSEYEALLKKRRGRPKKSLNHKPSVHRFAKTRFPSRFGEVNEGLLPVEILFQMLRVMTAEGNVSASEFLQVMEERYTSAPHERSGTGYLVAPESLDAETWIKKQEEKNKHRKPPSSDWRPIDKK